MPYRDHHKRRARDRERHRRRAEHRRAQGLCPRCGRNAPDPGRSQCAVCLEKRRAADRLRAGQRKAAGIKRVRDPKARRDEYRRARRRADERVAQGTCARCARHPHEPDRRLCATCGERQRWRDRDRYAKARDAGSKYGGRDVHARRRQARRRSHKRRNDRRRAARCIRCGRRPPVEGGSSCEPCLDSRRQSDRATYAERKAAGLCTRCSAPTFDGAPLCGPCTVTEARYRPAKRDANRARYAKRRKRWICTHCGKAPSFGASRCEDCARKSWARSEHVRGIPDWDPACTVFDKVSGDHLGTWDRWEDAVLALSFEGVSLEDVELLSERSPMHAMAGWS